MEYPGTEPEEKFERTCLVCGHRLGPLDRICDLCGSIQRPHKTGGARTGLDRFGTCTRCGEQVPFGKHICAKCDKLLHPPKKRRPPSTARVLATIVLVAAVVAAVAGAALVADGGAAAGEIVLLAVGACLVVAAGGYLVWSSVHRGKPKVL